MWYNKYKFFTLFLFCIIIPSASGQESMVCSGGNASGSGGSLSYSIGQLSYNQYYSTGGWVEQGVQHVYEIYSLDISAYVSSIPVSCKVFPNPSTDILNIRIENVGNKNINYRLFDNSGKLLEEAHMDSEETNISMKNYSSGIYVLNINSDNTVVKKIKIIKN